MINYQDQSDEEENQQDTSKQQCSLIEEDKLIGNILKEEEEELMKEDQVNQNKSGQNVQLKNSDCNYSLEFQDNFNDYQYDQRITKQRSSSDNNIRQQLSENQYLNFINQQNTLQNQHEVHSDQKLTLDQINQYQTQQKWAFLNQNFEQKVSDKQVLNQNPFFLQNQNMKNIKTPFFNQDQMKQNNMQIDENMISKFDNFNVSDSLSNTEIEQQKAKRELDKGESSTTKGESIDFNPIQLEDYKSENQQKQINYRNSFNNMFQRSDSNSLVIQSNINQFNQLQQLQQQQNLFSQSLFQDVSQYPSQQRFSQPNQARMSNVFQQQKDQQQYQIFQNPQFVQQEQQNQQFLNQYQQIYQQKPQLYGRFSHQVNQTEFVPLTNWQQQVRHSHNQFPEQVPQLSQIPNQQINMQLQYGNQMYNPAYFNVQNYNNYPATMMNQQRQSNISQKSNNSSVSQPKMVQTSQFLEEFKQKLNSNKEMSIIDIQNHIIECSLDQQCSRFIQQKLEMANELDKALLFDGLLQDPIKLMKDVFGNYVIQKMFEHGNHTQQQQLFIELKGKVFSLSQDQYGCRVIQKALEILQNKEKEQIINEIKHKLKELIDDQNGNHVIQKIIETMSNYEQIQFIIDYFCSSVYEMSVHQYGCRIIQRMLEHCQDNQIRPILDEAFKRVLDLTKDQYGNYVISHVLEHGRVQDKDFVIGKMKKKVLQLSLHKYGSNVIEKCIVNGSWKQREELMSEVIYSKIQENDNFLNKAGTIQKSYSLNAQNIYLNDLIKDKYGNYVIQRVLDMSNQEQRDTLIDKIKRIGLLIKKNNKTHAKHVFNFLEKNYGVQISSQQQSEERKSINSQNAKPKKP